jgi:Fe-S-cluster containining protein
MDKFSMLRDFYRNLDAFLETIPSPAEGCGSCRECCDGLLFYITRLEYDLMVKSLEEQGLPLTTRFRVAVRPEDDSRTPETAENCPFYEEGLGCRVYDARPLACRLYGKYIPAKTVHFEKCVYREPARYSTIDEIPLWSEYEKVIRRYPSLPGYFERVKPDAQP